MTGDPLAAGGRVREPELEHDAIGWRLAGNERFFGRSAFEAVDPAVAAGSAAPFTTGGRQ